MVSPTWMVVLYIFSIPSISCTFFVRLVFEVHVHSTLFKVLLNEPNKAIRSSCREAILDVGLGSTNPFVIPDVHA